MKKSYLIICMIFLAGLLMAMKPLSEKDLAGISGQTGVSFFVDITMNIHIDTLAWGDSDGLGHNNIWSIQTTGGYIDASGLSITGLSIRNSSNSMSFWPASTPINIYNGKPYYKVNLGADQS